MSFPRHFYTDAAIFERDINWLRQTTWFIAGHQSQTPRTGDYFVYELANDSIIIIRDQDGKINAHHNVCRHRGSRICLESEGTVRNLTCPYHSWSYGLNGQLVGTPFMPNTFDKTAFSLHSCHVRVYHGLIFVCLAEVAPDFESYIGFLGPELVFAPFAGCERSVIIRKCGAARTPRR
jgi:Rieske 2Fe-2S family protein